MRLNRHAAPLAALLIVSAPLCGASALAQDSEFVGISMFGEYVPQGGGLDDASGDFDGEFDIAGGQICYYLDLIGIRNPTGIAIHRGEERDTGEMVVQLQLPATEGEEVCVSVEADLQREMLADLSGFYMVVTDPSHPQGAIRGQLDF